MYYKYLVHLFFPCVQSNSIQKYSDVFIFKNMWSIILKYWSTFKISLF